MTNIERQMMNAALPRCRSYGPELTENEQVIVLQGERIAELEAELSQANSDRQREHDLRVTLASQVESLQSKCAHCPRPAVVDITLGDPINYGLCQRCADLEDAQSDAAGEQK